jgi:UDP-hydrolysing UDP-N-acetyl-D-glucosamine 2-epimerase
MPLKICVVTGGRADFGLLSMPMKAIRASSDLELQLVVTGQHLSHDGHGLKAIENGGFHIDAVVDMALMTDDAKSLTEAAGRELIGIAAAFNRLRPDIVMILGDRYEILAAAYAALLASIPIAHLCGGDITEGAFDDAIRHALTKLSHIHFVTNEDAARRVRQMGEEPSRVLTVGSPGIDAILAIAPLSRDRFFAEVGLADRRPTFLVTLHPSTLADAPLAECREMLAALEAHEHANFVFTGVNADPGASAIADAIQAFCRTHPQRARQHTSLGSALYFTALTHCDAVIGNSSSGLYEAPSFDVPTVNIGERQTGRLKASSVFDCVADRGAIETAIAKALAFRGMDVVNPYGDGLASKRIVDTLRRIEDPKALLRKRFDERTAH